MEKIYGIDILKYRFSGIEGGGLLEEYSCGLGAGRGFGNGKGVGDPNQDLYDLYGDRYVINIGLPMFGRYDDVCLIY